MVPSCSSSTLLPRLVADVRQVVRRRNDVGEQHGRQRAIIADGGVFLTERKRSISARGADGCRRGRSRLLAAGQLDEAGARDPACSGSTLSRCPKAGCPDGASRAWALAPREERSRSRFCRGLQLPNGEPAVRTSAASPPPLQNGIMGNPRVPDPHPLGTPNPQHASCLACTAESSTELGEGGSKVRKDQGYASAQGYVARRRTRHSPRSCRARWPDPTRPHRGTASRSSARVSGRDASGSVIGSDAPQFRPS